MNEVNGEIRQDENLIMLSGRIDSGNAADAEQEILKLTEDILGEL